MTIHDLLCIGTHINHLPLSSNAARDNCLVNDGGGPARTNDLHFISPFSFVAPEGTAGRLKPSFEANLGIFSVEQFLRIRALTGAMAPNLAPN